jgi:hypothetical protein
LKNEKSPMTKNDWTVLFVRVVGLYLVATHLASFVTTTASLVVALTQVMDKRQVTANIYVWQGPVVSGLVLVIGLLLILKASTVSTAIQKHDRS